MSLRKISIAIGLSAGMTLAAQTHAAISDNVLRLGVLTDLSGVLSAVEGTGSILAVEMAVEDLKEELKGINVEVISADHQNKADVGAEISRRWFDIDNVDAVFDVGNSAVGLAVQSVIKEKNKVAMYSAVATTELTGKQCASTGFAWLHNAYNLVSGPINSLTAEGHDTWFFIAADYAFGKDMVRLSKQLVEDNGGKTVGEVFHPLGETDYSSYLLQAQASNAKVVAFANAGLQLVSSMKQWDEFGMRSGSQIPIAQLMFISDVHGMGAEVAQGLSAPVAWYWEVNEESKEFSRRFYERHKTMPTAPQASMYSAARHYLKAVISTGSDDTDQVAAEMRNTPVDDFYAKGSIREDSALYHDFYLVKVKAPENVSEPWAYYDVVRTIPADEAFSPLSDSECPLVKNTTD